MSYLILCLCRMMNFTEQDWQCVVTLSEAKGLSRVSKFSVGICLALACHPERSEGSLLRAYAVYSRAGFFVVTPERSEGSLVPGHSS